MVISAAINQIEKVGLRIDKTRGNGGMKFVSSLEGKEKMNELAFEDQSGQVKLISLLFNVQGLMFTDKA